MFYKKLVFGLIALSFLGATATAHARITDATGDFLTSYTGAQGGDLDVVTADVVFDGTGFTLTTTLADAIGTTPNAVYVWGLDRGTAHPATAPFASIGITNVFFDSVIIVRPDTTVTINRLNGGGTTNLTAGAATINGNTISTRISPSELPSQGFAPNSYTWNLWPRINGGTTANISDFAPNNSNVAVVAVPEASSTVLLTSVIFTGLGLGIVRRRAQKVA